MAEEMKWEHTVDFETLPDPTKRKEEEAEAKFNLYLGKLNNYTQVEDAQKDLQDLAEWYVKNKENECTNEDDDFLVPNQWEINIHRMLESLILKIGLLSEESTRRRMSSEEEIVNYNALMAPVPCAMRRGGRTRKRKRKRKKKKTRKRRRKKSRKKRKRRKRRTRK